MKTLYGLRSMYDENNIENSKTETSSPEEKTVRESITQEEEEVTGEEKKDPENQIDTFIRILLYIFSFFMGPFGLGVILGAIFFVQTKQEYRDVGRVCIILAIIPSLLVIVFGFFFLSLGFLSFLSRLFF